MTPEMTNKILVAGNDSTAYSVVVTHCCTHTETDCPFTVPVRDNIMESIILLTPDPTNGMDEHGQRFPCWLNCGACWNKTCHREQSMGGIPEYRYRNKVRENSRMSVKGMKRFFLKGRRI